MNRRQFVSTIPVIALGTNAAASTSDVSKPFVPPTLPELPIPEEAWERTLLNRWEQTGLLNCVPPHMRQDMALVLENQRLQNEQCTEAYDVTQFRRISIPLCVRIFAKLNHNQFKITSSMPEEADVRHIGFGFWNKTVKEQFRSLKQHSLDEEAEKTAALANVLTKKINSIIKTFCNEGQEFHFLNLDVVKNNRVVYHPNVAPYRHDDYQDSIVMYYMVKNQKPDGQS